MIDEIEGVIADGNLDAVGVATLRRVQAEIDRLCAENADHIDALNHVIEETVEDHKRISARLEAADQGVELARDQEGPHNERARALFFAIAEYDKVKQ